MLDTEGLLYDVIDVSLEGELYEEQLRRQLELLTISEEKYTDSGLFTYFYADDKISKLKLSKSQIKNMGVVFINIELINKQLNILADVIIHMKDGIIDKVEIWNKTGVNYPKEELLTYELKIYK